MQVPFQKETIIMMEGKKKDISVFAKATYRLNDKVSLYGDLQMRNVDYKTSGHKF